MIHHIPSHEIYEKTVRRVFMAPVAYTITLDSLLSIGLVNHDRMCRLPVAPTPQLRHNYIILPFLYRFLDVH